MWILLRKNEIAEVFKLKKETPHTQLILDNIPDIINDQKNFLVRYVQSTNCHKIFQRQIILAELLTDTTLNSSSQVISALQHAKIDPDEIPSIVHAWLHDIDSLHISQVCFPTSKIGWETMTFLAPVELSEVWYEEVKSPSGLSESVIIQDSFQNYINKRRWCYGDGDIVLNTDSSGALMIYHSPLHEMWHSITKRQWAEGYRQARWYYFTWDLFNELIKSHKITYATHDTTSAWLADTEYIFDYDEVQAEIISLKYYMYISGIWTDMSTDITLDHIRQLQDYMRSLEDSSNLKHGILQALNKVMTVASINSEAIVRSANKKNASQEYVIWVLFNCLA